MVKRKRTPWDNTPYATHHASKDRQTFSQKLLSDCMNTGKTIIREPRECFEPGKGFAEILAPRPSVRGLPLLEPMRRTHYMQRRARQREQEGQKREQKKKRMEQKEQKAKIMSEETALKELGFDL